MSSHPKLCFDHTMQLFLSLFIDSCLRCKQIVTLEDVVEEIVGEIFDENDSKVKLTVLFFLLFSPARRQTSKCNTVIERAANFSI